MQDDIEKALNAHLPNRIIEFNENSSVLNVSDYEVGFRDGYRAHAARSGWVAIAEYERTAETHVVLLPYNVERVVLVAPDRGNNPHLCLELSVPPQSKGGE